MGTLKSRMLTKWTVNAVAGTAIEVGLTVGTISGSRKQGDSLAVTAAKTGMDILTNAYLGPIGSFVYFGATVGYDMMLQTSKQNAELQKQMKYTGSGRVGSGYFNMSGAGYTMRQRAINQLRANGQNVNSVLGNEARNYLKSSQTYY
jgi:RsiW-degrading membrane proteinase PrsW (M82 family)